MADRHVYFASCAPGLEPVLHAEARELRLARAERQVGGIYFEGEAVDEWRACHGLRTAIRVFRRLARFEARDADELYRGAAEVDWSRYVRPDGTLLVDAQSRESELFHTHFLQQRVKDAVVDRLRAASGARPSVDPDHPDLRVHVHVFRDRVTLSADASGGSLHKRGWRVHQGRAPLAETTAAGVVHLAGWDRRAPLLDPFCGSGTIAIEAAMLAAGIPPGRKRAFGFERWPGHDAAAFARFRAEREAAAEPPRKLVLRAFDADAGQVEAARENAASAGVDELVSFEVADARDFAPRPGWNAWIVTNPPYGVRVGDAEELLPVYRDFGARLRERCAGYVLALLSGSRDLARELGLGKVERTKLKNGALDCILLVKRL